MLAINVGKDFLNVNGKSTITSKTRCHIRWNPPCRGFRKINFDGYVVNSKTAVGFIIRNKDGDSIIAGARYLGGI